jgi:hypothetical protein
MSKKVKLIVKGSLEECQSEVMTRLDDAQVLSCKELQLNQCSFWIKTNRVLDIYN